MTKIHRNRTSQSTDHMLAELLFEPSGEFENFLRMSSSDFSYILDKISPVISKKHTQLREPIPAKTRLAITLRFLATGDSYKSLHFLFKVSSQIISIIVPEVCAAINDLLKDEIKLPSSAAEWLLVEEGFNKKFPHCIGVIDGKHVVLQSPPHTGSEYYNYKNSFSIVLMALVSSDYRFIYADIGSQGRISDGGVLRNSLLWQKICSNSLNLPTPSPLHGSNTSTDIPYVFLGDGAFALSANLMKPYPGNHAVGSPKRIFNQRLSSSRVVVENVFGILTAKFRIFKKPILLEPEKVSIITMTCILLHNFLRRSETSASLYNPPGTMDVCDENGLIIQSGSWRNEIEGNGALRPFNHIPRRSPMDATQIREEFTSYFFNNRQ